MAPAPIQPGSFLSAAFLTILETAEEALLVFDAAGVCALAGRKLGELFDVEPSALVGRPRPLVLAHLAACCEEPEPFLEAVGDDDRGEPTRCIGNIEIRKPRPRTVVWTSVPIGKGPTGGASAHGRLVLVRDVTRERSAERSMKQLQARVQELTPLDALTGLPNVKRFREDLAREHGRSTRAWDSYAVLVVDIDGMRTINDEFGFPVGDEVLERVAACLRATKREYDAVARFDADAFVVLLPSADAVAASAVATRMANAVEAHRFEHDAAGGVRVSIGGAVWVPPSAEGPDDVLARAQERLRAAQLQGGGVILESEPPAPAP